MKLIEKLAMEHVESQLRPTANELIKIYSQMDYLAGFRKAREMAYELMKENADKRIFSIDVDIENLGESEVEE